VVGSRFGQEECTGDNLILAACREEGVKLGKAKGENGIMPERILIVDDDATMVNLLATILDIEEMEPLKALSAREAFAVLDKEIPDLILLDIMMPELDGFEVLARLRKHPETKDLPVIILSALSDRKNMLKGWREQADEWVCKPFDPMALVGTIKQVLEKSLEERQAERARHIDDLLNILEKIDAKNTSTQV
jgi:DNA-binding response OmpR family regulator